MAIQRTATTYCTLILCCDLYVWGKGCAGERDNLTTATMGFGAKDLGAEWTSTLDFVEQYLLLGYHFGYGIWFVHAEQWW